MMIPAIKNICLLIFTLLILIGCNHRVPAGYQPGWLKNTIWEYTGGEMKVSRTIFRPDGSLVFEVEFTELNPAYWRYDAAAHELYIIIPNIRQEKLNRLVTTGSGEVKRVDRNKRALIYDFDEKTDVFDFMGWNYYKKREVR